MMDQAAGEALIVFARDLGLIGVQTRRLPVVARVWSYCWHRGSTR